MKILGMKINANTKISRIIKDNNDAVEVIASLDTRLEKLRNPILRKLIAPRLNIVQAAKMGNCEVDEMLNQLVKIGFEIDENESEQNLETNNSVQLEEKLEFIGNRKLEYLDVRPYLNRGEDPLKMIQNIIKALTDEQVLEIVLSFEPVPLIKIEERFGFEWMTIVENNLYHTYFKRGADMKYLPTGESKFIRHVEREEFEKVVDHYTEEIISIDVRMLEMPEPMITILEKLEEMKTKPKSALKVFHKRIPQFLIPELEKKRFQTIVCPIDQGNVMLFIYRDGTI